MILQGASPAIAEDCYHILFIYYSTMLITISCDTTQVKSYVRDKFLTTSRLFWKCLDEICLCHVLDDDSDAVRLGLPYCWYKNRKNDRQDEIREIENQQRNTAVKIHLLIYNIFLFICY